MNKHILNSNNQEFINENLKSNIAELALKNYVFKDVSIKALIEQIEAKKKCEKKLPTWFKTSQIYYPNKLNIEQSSSEIAASYKSNLISGNSMIDLTGGFGVDSFYFSKQFKTVTHCEINDELSQIVKHNFSKLSIKNINTINTDGVEYIKQSNEIFDWIYIDPSRRHGSKGKVFYLKDCLPNVPEHLPSLFKHTTNVLVKVSPMLDISIGVSELVNVKTIHIIAIKNEVKELLFHLEKGYSGAIEIKTANIGIPQPQYFNFNLGDTEKAKVNYSHIDNYLYEPNTALLKSGAFNLISDRLEVNKLHQHTHLYTSKMLIEFPGRRFKVLEIVPYNNKAVIKAIGSKQINLSTRNFSESISQLKKKFKLKDGGNIYVFFTTQLEHKKVVVICEKI